MSTGSKQAPTPPPTPPPVRESSADVAQVGAEERKKARNRTGYQSTLLSTGENAKKSLLG